MSVLHTCFVKSTNPGGRLYDGIDQNVARKNGEFGFLGDYANNTHGVPTGQTQVRVFEAPTNTTAANKGRMPVVIMQPEVMYDNSRKSLTKLSLMEVPKQTPFCCVPLEEGDKIEITADALFKNGGNAAADGTDLEVNKCYILTDNKSVLQLTNTGNAPADTNTVYFKIVKVKDAHARTARIGGALVAGNYKLYTLEVLVKR